MYPFLPTFRKMVMSPYQVQQKLQIWLLTVYYSQEYCQCVTDSEVQSFL